VDVELSIARIDELSADQTWSLGDRLAGAPSGRTVCGRADFRLPDVQATRVNGAKFDAVPDDPPERHALIIGWPPATSARKAAAMQLLAASTRCVRPNPLTTSEGH
jgi:hypothetical protein